MLLSAAALSAFVLLGLAALEVRYPNSDAVELIGIAVRVIGVVAMLGAAAAVLIGIPTLFAAGIVANG